MIRIAALLSACLVAIGAPAFAQKKAGSAIAKVGLEDPYTGKDAKLMAKLGVVQYGPLTWADNLRTTDIEKVLGEGRVLWFETEHFKIGSNFGYCGSPKDTDARRRVKDELKQLKKRSSKMPSSKSKLDPWLRAHLYALRAEQLYDEIAELTGKQDADGHLGQKEKFLLLLFQKKSDLVRYLKRFCNVESEMSQNQRHFATGHFAVVMTAEGDDGPRDCETSYAQFRFLLTQTLLEAVGEAPPWLRFGLAHRYEREVPCSMINCGIRADESVDPASQYDWPKKMAKRCKHEALCIPFAKLCREFDLGYYGHVQSWSRVDYLMQDRAKFAVFLQKVMRNASRNRQVQALAEVYDLDPEGFDAAWRDWARKYY